MIKEAIILAGGLGTRLRNAVPGLPKCMAPVNGKPFIDYVIRYLKAQGVEHFIFALGYMHEEIEKYINKEYPSIHKSFSIEDSPMGTGGAIRLACSKVKDKNILIMNGDTLFAINIASLSDFHEYHSAACTIALKPMKNFDRYGVVETDKDGHIKSFNEKKSYQEGLINGGVYLINTTIFKSLNFPPIFSFEKDFLEKYVSTIKIMGVIQDKFFIDIGIPEDYNRASKELPYSIDLISY